MATADEVVQLRSLVAEPDETTFTDAELSDIFDGAASMNAAAADIWRRKAARSASLVNVAESGSSRSLGDLTKQALTMAEQFSALQEQESAGNNIGGVRINRIVRR